MRASNGSLGALLYVPGTLVGLALLAHVVLPLWPAHRWFGNSMTRKPDDLANPELSLEIDRKVLRSKPSWSAWQDPVSANKPSLFKSQNRL